MTEADYAQMLGADTAEIIKPGRLFLVIGYKKRSVGEWTKNGEPFDFDYIDRQVIANGKDHAALEAAARHYKSLLEADDGKLA